MPKRTIPPHFLQAHLSHLMAAKGLDTTFLHYGIRTADMAVIQGLCATYGLDFDWLKEEVLKNFHEARLKDHDLEDKAVEKLLEKALQKTG